LVNISTDAWQMFFLLGSGFVLVLIFYMLMRLYMTRANKSYIQFSSYVSLNIIMYCFAFYFITSGYSLSSLSGHSYLLFEIWSILCIVLLNIGIYRLYNTFTFEAQVVSYSTIMVTLIVGIISLFLGYSTFRYIFAALDIVLIVGSVFVVGQSVGQRIKFTLSIIGILMLPVSLTIHQFHKLDDFITVIVYASTFIGYGIFFIIVFERSIELIQLVYHSSITDGLTGLYNRKYFYNFLEKEIKLRNQIGAVFTDIDNFKKLNDSQGHQKGDEALRHVANIAKEVSDGVGIAGRYGGEEIVLLITDGNVKEIAERFRSRIENETNVTVSVGYHNYVPGTSPGDFIKQSDIAMYHSKQNGKNRVTGYMNLTAEQIAQCVK
jgi:diguanylate cyclase (GGDEF)-like protein